LHFNQRLIIFAENLKRMGKKILYTFLSLALAFAMPAQSHATAPEAEAQVEQQLEQPKITVDGNIIQVSNANGKYLVVYDLTGKMVRKVKIDGDDRRFDLALEPGACYIIKVDKVVRKVAIAKA